MNRFNMICRTDSQPGDGDSFEPGGGAARGGRGGARGCAPHHVRTPAPGLRHQHRHRRRTRGGRRRVPTPHSARVRRSGVVVFKVTKPYP